MKKRAMIAAGLVAFIFSTTSAAAEISYSDVSADFWAAEEIGFMADQKVMTGYENGLFGANDDMTRSQAARTLARIHGLDTANPAPVSFTDVKESDSAYPAIAAAVEAGYFIDGEAFHPNDKLTRAQMAAILTRSYNLESNAHVDYRDVSKQYWAYDNISLLGEHRLTTGYPDLTFRPSENVTRSQFAVFLSRAEEESFRKEVAVLPQLAAEDIYYPRVTGLESASQEQINQTLKAHADNSVIERKALLDTAQHEENEELADAYDYVENYRIEQNDSNYLSVVFEVFQYTGGAHGMSAHTAYTFNPETGNQLELSDLFSANTDYETIINHNVSEVIKDKEQQLEYGQYHEFDGIDPNTSQFYVTNKGPAVYFSEYEIGPYSLGIPSFIIPWEAFEPVEVDVRPVKQEFSFEQEGMQQTDTFKLMDETGMPFSTYIPQYFEVENVSSGSGDEVLVYAKFTEDSAATEEPVWRFNYPSYGKADNVTLESMIQEVHDYAAREEVNLKLVDEEHNPNFGEYRARFETEAGMTYWVTILKYNDTFLEWHQEYPVELEEGIGPRETVVKEQWVWGQ
ncbi:S-layer homology domain-containing protein [Bacillus solitudinis]|uniref:S-layer homology domain-containing protein n=1 Tax=Bacillus solitudinis TaxID=2014074 RepID=UPI000C238814|nr:S-layer homology domain-containing protein [Bacillus solitudinis]